MRALEVEETSGKNEDWKGIVCFTNKLTNSSGRTQWPCWITDFDGEIGLLTLWSPI